MAAKQLWVDISLGWLEEKEEEEVWSWSDLNREQRHVDIESRGASSTPSKPTAIIYLDFFNHHNNQPPPSSSSVLIYCKKEQIQFQSNTQRKLTSKPKIPKRMEEDTTPLGETSNDVSPSKHYGVPSSAMQSLTLIALSSSSSQFMLLD